jgi:hypothetical protein
MSITTEEIRQLCIAHDQFMADQASEPIRRPPVSETDSAVYKEFDNSLPAPAAESLPAASVQDIVHGIADGTRMLLDRELGRRDRKIARQERMLARLRGELDAVLSDPDRMKFLERTGSELSRRW